MSAYREKALVPQEVPPPPPLNADENVELLAEQLEARRAWFTEQGNAYPPEELDSVLKETRKAEGKLLIEGKSPFKNQPKLAAALGITTPVAISLLGVVIMNKISGVDSSFVLEQMSGSVSFVSTMAIPSVIAAKNLLAQRKISNFYEAYEERVREAEQAKEPQKNPEKKKGLLPRLATLFTRGKEPVLPQVASQASAPEKMTTEKPAEIPTSAPQRTRIAASASKAVGAPGTRISAPPGDRTISATSGTLNEQAIYFPGHDAGSIIQSTEQRVR